MTFRNNPALSTTKILNAQWTDCPEEVVEEVRTLWRNYEFGNDNYYAMWDQNEEFLEEYPVIYQYLNEQGIVEGERLLIHWWW